MNPRAIPRGGHLQITMNADCKHPSSIRTSDSLRPAPDSVAPPARLPALPASRRAKAFAVSVASAVCAALAPLPGFAAPGDLDPSFDADIASGVVRAMAVQPDGRLVIGGNFTTVAGQTRNRVARLETDGSLDGGFNPGTDFSVRCIAVQADGKVVIGGFFQNVAGQTRAHIARLEAGGTLDAGFNPGTNDAVLCIAVQADGKLVIGGSFATVAGQSRTHLARLNADGTLDAGFNPGASSDVFCIAVQPDGKLVIGGSFTTVAGQTFPRIARLNADGTLDAGFNNPGAMDGSPDCIAVQPDGKLVIGGSFTTVAGQTRERIARLNADGTLDAGFNPSVGPGNVSSIALQSDGRLVIGGNFEDVNGEPRIDIARLNADGTLDPGFTDGSGPPLNNGVFGFALQADGMPIVGGQFLEIGGQSRVALARLLNDSATGAPEATSRQRVEWLRGGSAPEAQYVSFELSTDGGVSFAPLGFGSRVAGGWELPGLALPGSGLLRARARTVGGAMNGSTGLVEATAAFAGLPGLQPPVALRRPVVRVRGKARLAVSRPRVVLRGTSRFAERVEFRAPGAKFRRAQGVDRWRAAVRLRPGRNAVIVRALGPGGRSQPARVVILRRR